MADATADHDPEQFRTEHDSMGEVSVPAHAHWGAQTQRAVENFPISGRPIAPALIRALALVKAEAAAVNAESDEVEAVDQRVGAAIRMAADEVAEGRLDEHFPVDVFQTGSGTSSNMNANEVIARLASEHLGEPAAVHPNDHVNASQSSNDVFPTAIQIATAEGVTRDLVPALAQLADALRAKAAEFSTVVKSGRTHLMDAVPVTLGQEFGGYATQVEQAVERLVGTVPRVAAIPLGGTAVGTGINAPRGFGGAVAARLAERTGLPITEAADHFAAQAAPDALVEVSSQLRGAAVALTKIANDIRWMASGPRTGLAEIHLPDLQPGSSIMPGKVNPVLCEAVTQVCAQVIGNDAAVAFAGSQGNLELNVYLPLIARNLLESITLLGNVSRLFADRCVAGITADVERCRTYAETSPSIATSLNPYLGYERTAALIKQSLATGASIRSLVEATGELSPEQIDAALDALALTSIDRPPAG
ncbi:MAG: class II fumarate hydratase [Acidimicrobiales bacterium]|nr:class II fumarate hydratase [Acidimicrobiales bacterium]